MTPEHYVPVDRVRFDKMLHTLRSCETRSAFDKLFLLYFADRDHARLDLQEAGSRVAREKGWQP